MEKSVDFALVGRRVAALPRRSRRFSPDRRCSAPGCDTALSIYNGSPYCWEHRHAGARKLPVSVS